jgi:anti-anti-sigma regulatory factor
MLRITTDNSGDDVLIKLEGCLAGAWVDELSALWREVIGTRSGRSIRIDMREVCHVDAAGRALMTRMYLHGTRYVTTGCVMPEVVREISESPEVRGDGDTQT